MLKKDKLKSLERKTMYQGEILDEQWLEHVCGRETGGSQAGEG